MIPSVVWVSAEPAIAVPDSWCQVPKTGLAQTVPNSARVNSAKTSWPWRRHWSPCPEGIFHIKSYSIAWGLVRRRIKKEIGIYLLFLPPDTGRSAGRNAKFMEPGEQEQKKLCSWLVRWDERVLLLSPCMHCALKSHRVKHVHSPWRALCQSCWCLLTCQVA